LRVGRTTRRAARSEKTAMKHRIQNLEEYRIQPRHKTSGCAWTRQAGEITAESQRAEASGKDSEIRSQESEGKSSADCAEKITGFTHFSHDFPHFYAQIRPYLRDFVRFLRVRACFGDWRYLASDVERIGGWSLEVLPDGHGEDGGFGTGVIRSIRALLRNICGTSYALLAFVREFHEVAQDRAVKSRLFGF